MKMTPCDIIHIDETDSTNNWLRQHGGPDNMVVWADHQTAGRGCGTNTWEAERGLNLTFSMLIHHTGIPARQQWNISMGMALAVVDALATYIGTATSDDDTTMTDGGTPASDGSNGLSIKWPNDIYWHDRKICGILIEHRLAGNMLKDSIIGVGLNVNQHTFVSDAPNPVSLSHIVGHEVSRREVLQRVVDAFALPADGNRYLALLYRRRGNYPYRDAEGPFMAELVTVESDGRLLLRDTEGRLRRYAHKEVAFEGIPKSQDIAPRDSETSLSRNNEIPK